MYARVGGFEERRRVMVGRPRGSRKDGIVGTAIAFGVGMVRLWTLDQMEVNVQWLFGDVQIGDVLR